MLYCIVYHVSADDAFAFKKRIHLNYLCSNFYKQTLLSLHPGRPSYPAPRPRSIAHVMTEMLHHKSGQLMLTLGIWPYAQCHG